MEVFQRGSITLIRGDCFEYLKTKEIKEVFSVVADVPYGMDFRSNFRKQKHKKIAGDSSTDSITRLVQWLKIQEALHSAYIFCRWENLRDSNCVLEPSSVITWVKPNWSMGNLKHEHARQTEQIAFIPGSKHEWPSNRPTDVIFANRTTNKLHPTEKPVHLMAQIIAWTNGLVFDPFLGSGSTALAAMQMGRRFIGIEVDKDYFQISCERVDEAFKKRMSGNSR